MRYIGVSGHRGAGKSSIAYLVGQTLNLLAQGHSKTLVDNEEAYDSFYTHWCKQLMDSENCVNEAELDHVYFESFSDSIKTFIRLLLGCPEEYLYEDRYKDTIVVNLRDLSCRPINTFSDDIKLYTSQEFYRFMSSAGETIPIIQSNYYMLLREFILYYGLEVMQRFFGRNIWVKSLRANSEQYDEFYGTGVNYKVFIDLKTPAEATYIKQANGFIINVIRPANKKGQSGLERLNARYNDKIDYNITVEGDLYSLKDEIRKIAKDINNKFKENE